MKNVWKVYSLVLTLVVVVPLIGSVFPTNMDHMMGEFTSMKNEMQQDMMMDGKYRCCLQKPCTYCLEKTPGHGIVPTCDCLADIVNGKHPCGECIGEILEGHGNPYLVDYFAVAIAEETGEIEAIQRIINEKYGLSTEESL